MSHKIITSRSSMQMAMITRLLSMTVTLFILILTVKSDLLEYKIISWQLALAIPLLFAVMVSNSRITNSKELNNYRKFNIFANSLPIALISNVIGLLVSKYVNEYLGAAYFVVFISSFIYFFAKDWEHGKYHNEAIIILVSIAFGLIPSLIGVLK